MITLNHLRRATRNRHLNLEQLSRALGLSPTGLKVRLFRGSPEITPDESARIARVLLEDGIVLAEPVPNRELEKA